MRVVVKNVIDRRQHPPLIGAWEVDALVVASLTRADVGRTVIYCDHGRAEAGTLVSWRGDTVFARYSSGDTAAGASADRLVFGTSRRRA